MSFLPTIVTLGGALYLGKDYVFKKETVKSVIQDYIDTVRKAGVKVSTRTEENYIYIAEAIDVGRELARKRMKEGHMDQFRTGDEYYGELYNLSNFLMISKQEAVMMKPTFMKVLDKKISRYETLASPLLFTVSHTHKN